MAETPEPVPSVADDTIAERVGAGGSRVVDFDELLAGTVATVPVATLDEVVPRSARPAPRAGATVDDVTPARPAATATLDDVVPARADEPARVADLDEARRARRSKGRSATSARGQGAGRTVADLEPGPAPIGDPEPAAAARAARRSRPTITRRGDVPHAADGPDADPESAARAICLRLLTDRSRTKQELAKALRRKGVPDDVARTVLERFDDVGLVDDGAFAEQWVRSRHAVRGLGRRALAAELRRKGVADDVAAEALTGIDAEAEERRARELADRKLRSLRTDTDEQRAAAGRKLVGMLARKGYGGGMAYRVVRDVLAARGAELDEIASEPPIDD